MNSLSVIIPSRNEANLRACVSAIRAAGETCRIIVVDDFDPTSPSYPKFCELLDLSSDLVQTGADPFVFARNINIGIRAAGDDDVVLLNDDALLLSRDGFQCMWARSEYSDDIGLISACTNIAGNPQQIQQIGGYLRSLKLPTPGNSFPTVAFVCVLIPRRTINQVGLLDERFTAYGWEDNDYCRRVHAAGLSIAVDDACFVDHASLQSTFRASAYAGGDINEGRKIYLAKWGSV